MALSEIDRNLLERCLARKPRAWEDFVDRFLGVVVHVVNHSAQARSIRLSADERDDLTAEIFFALCKDDFVVLRHFRGQSSLATYLTVVARRIAVREMLARKQPARLSEAEQIEQSQADGALQQLVDRDEVERLLQGLTGSEADIVRLYYLEGKSYAEISAATGVSENTLGPLLSRARDKMRALAEPSAGGA